MAFVITGRAQPCTPDLSYTIPGVYPDTLPYGYDGQSYSTVVDFKIPKDTVVGCLPTAIDSFQILGLEGLPPGFTWACNTSNCIVLGGDNGCAEIIGVPDTTMISIWPLKLITRTWAMVFGSVPLLQIDTIRDFYLTICSADSICTPDTLSGLNETLLQQNPFRFDIYPNPILGWSTIEVRIGYNVMVQLEITDMFGRQALTGNFDLHQGINKIPLDLSGFNSGMYFISLYTKNGSSIKKIFFSGE